MIKNFRIYFLIAGLLTANFKYGQGVNYVGTSSANFLKIGLGAKTVGIAESDLTLAEDASSFYWNPATISRIGSNSLAISYVNWLVETSVAYAGVAIDLDYVTAGLEVSYFSSGDIEETTLLEQKGTGRYFSTNDFSIGLGVARNLTDRFSVGVKIKYINENLSSVSASAIAFDVGSVFVTSFLNDMKIGIALSNFGGSMKFNGQDLLVSHVVPGSPTNKEIPAVLETKSWDIPLFFKIGLSTEIFKVDNFAMQSSYTLTDARDFQPRHNIGTSLKFLDNFTIRGGYRFNYDEVTFSAGAGAKVNLENLGQIQFDYAYTDFGSFSDIHQISLAINF
ncbi:MAG: PorV/PorQ family protein [Ignavibacteriae bacterium]|nr:PorV/PorQ family protein [Ignavibacteriota bacterium]